MDLNLSSIYHVFAFVKYRTLCHFFDGIWRSTVYCQVEPHIHIQIHKCGNENSSCLERLATTSYTTRIAAIRLGLLFLFRLHKYHCTKVVRCVISSGTAFWCRAVVCHPCVATPSERLESIASYLRLSRILFPAQGTVFEVLTS
jgi:hypothetical protein